jgi:hypothetical protein
VYDCQPFDRVQLTARTERAAIRQLKAYLGPDRLVFLRFSNADGGDGFINRHGGADLTGRSW